MKKEIIGNIALPSDRLKDLKNSNYLQTIPNNSSSNKITNSNTTEDTSKVKNFTKRLSELKSNNPDVLNNAASAARKNYT
jgi:hypothetical protein